MKNLMIDMIQFFLNHIVAHIPFWTLRKIFYLMAGMKIGKDARILMGCYIISPWKICIGSGTYINEKCVIDGRGGLSIGNDTSISMHTKIFTGTHDSDSACFSFTERKVVIGDNVWTGVNSIVLPGSMIPNGMILAAGSVAIPNAKGYKEYTIYSGVPAQEIRRRKVNEYYKQDRWKPWFR